VHAEVVYRREMTVGGSRSGTGVDACSRRLLPELDVPEPTVLPLERFGKGSDLFVRSGTVEVEGCFVPMKAAPRF